MPNYDEAKRAEVAALWSKELEAARKRFPQSMRLRSAFLQWNKRLSRTLGRAHYASNKIELAEQAFAVAEARIEEARDTIRHELAHLVAAELYGDRKHSGGFKRAAIELGARPEAFAPSALFGYMETKQRRNWRRLTCPECGEVFYASAQAVGRWNAEGRSPLCNCGRMLCEDEDRLTKSEANAEAAKRKARRAAQSMEEREAELAAAKLERAIDELEALKTEESVARMKYEAALAAWAESDSPEDELSALLAEDVCAAKRRLVEEAHKRYEAAKARVKGEEQC